VPGHAEAGLAVGVVGAGQCWGDVVGGADGDGMVVGTTTGGVLPPGGFAVGPVVGPGVGVGVGVGMITGGEPPPGGFIGGLGVGYTHAKSARPSRHSSKSAARRFLRRSGVRSQFCSGYKRILSVLIMVKERELHELLMN
jgi:hypothetical protein